jgi:alkaline phosphatase/alkaline phosphatase D
VHSALGILVGEVTTGGALVQVRLSATDERVDGDVPGAPGFVEFALAKEGAGASEPVAVQTAEARQAHDCIARTAFTGLEPGTAYACKTRVGSSTDSLRDGPTARFKTLPGADSAAPVRFVVVTGMNYAKFHGDDQIDKATHLVQNNTRLPDPYSGPDKHLGYPALASILKLKPDFFVGTGDNVYYDTPRDPRAETISELRQKWHEQFVQPRYHELFAKTPTYWMVDDHDYRVDDCDNTGDYEPSPELGKRVLLEQLPYAEMGVPDPLTYRTHRISRHLQIWLPEGRLYRSPNATPDGPDKTIWGDEQKAWLKRTLGESDAAYKLLISPTPMIGPDDLRKTDNHTNIGGFRAERDDFFAWLKETGIAEKGFYIICGDRHWQYHSIDPSGIEEFSSGALVDANSRLGRKPGDPKSTDPEGLIEQPYYQDPRSGGFLEVEVSPGADGDPPKLDLTWRDEHGEVLYSARK